MNKAIDQPAGKSDRAIVPVKQSNNPSKDAAETGEGRALAKRNVGEYARAQTQSWNSTMSRLARVREAAVKDKKQSFTALMHHVTPELLLKSFYELKRQAAKGVEGVSWNDYQINLDLKFMICIKEYKVVNFDLYQPVGFIFRRMMGRSDR